MNLHRMKRGFSKILCDESGGELVDFALCASVFAMLVLGTIDVCRAMYAYHIVTYGAQRATRYAIVRGATWPSSCSTSAPPNFTLNFGCKASANDVQNYVQSLGGFNSANLTVSTTWPGTTPNCSKNCSVCNTSNSKGCMVKVKVNYAFTFIVPFLKRGTVNLSANSQKMIQE
ncbi:pilus assembly protein [Acidobacteria bacterium AB60]|nr:pilus assembly protein [Acidobacteria bacterium AB60]